jgi:sugar (pentulose or hexulose) kinase
LPVTEELVIGIDLSTHGVKVLAVDAGGESHAEAHASYERVVAAGGVQEQPLEPVWQAVCQAVGMMMHSLPDRAKVVGLSVTHQRGTVVALDSSGQPMGAAICDSDTRSWPQANWLRTQVGAEHLYQLTGCPPFPFNGLSKMLWWCQTFPDQIHRLGHWLSMQDWLVWRLTGELMSSPGSAMRLGVLDIHNPQRYSDEVLSLADIPESTLPRLVPFGRCLGRIRPGPGREAGLPDGVPVFPSPGDQPAALIGSGALAADGALISLGTSFLTSFPLPEFVQTPAELPATLEVLPDGTYAMEFGEGAGTNVLDWLRVNLLGLSRVSDLDALASDSPPGANGLRVVPHWWAIMDDRRAGSIHGLHSHHTRSDLVRASFEGLVYELRNAWDRLEACNRVAPSEVAICGGASSSRYMAQMIANVFDRPVRRSDKVECSALGAAVTAAYALGWDESLVGAVEAMKPDSEVLLPDPPARDFYQRAYSAYFDLSD